MEHYRLGSSMVILSRSFCNTKLVTDLNEIEELFTNGVSDIRNFEKKLMSKAFNEYEKKFSERNEVIYMVDAELANDNKM